MSEDRQRIDPITAEYLVRGARDGMHGSDPLAQLLAAAATPARPDELAGEEAAVMAFRAANLARPPQSRRRSMLSTALAKVATVKAAVAVVAVSGGGIALAAGSGHLPGVSGSDHHPTARPDASATAGHHPTHSPASAGSADPGAAASHNSTPNGSPSPNLRGLCTAFTAGVGDNPGKALDNPAFTVLINTAGGKDKVAAYCATLVGAAHGKPSSHPGNGTHGAPSSHPGGGPATGHSGRPSSHPSGPPNPPSHPSPAPPTMPTH
jgi:hypothetical protein